MTIQNEKMYMEGIWDWAILRGCFGETRIMPTDLDGFVERKGHFLVLETKHIGARLPIGQELTLQALAKHSPTVGLVMWGRQNCPQFVQVFDHKGASPIYRCDLDAIRYIVSNWFSGANRNEQQINVLGNLPLYSMAVGRGA